MNEIKIPHDAPPERVGELMREALRRQAETGQAVMLMRVDEAGSVAVRLVDEDEIFNRRST